MKKLMITAGAVAIAAGAFATAPTVYDYKASVKHMYLKEMTIRDTSLANPQNVHIYQKIQKTSSLRGYLIQDTQACLGGNATGKAMNNRAWDHRRNRAFLVVLNSSAMPAELRQPKIMPAVLEAKYMDKAMTGRNYLTQGMLYVGGELCRAVTDVAAASLRPYLMPGRYAGGNNVLGTAPDLASATARNQSLENPTVTRVRQTAKGYYGDYLWTSAYLFGQYNGPQWSTLNWSIAEKKVIDAMPQWMKPRNTDNTVAEGIIDPRDLDLFNTATGNGYFHDTWMNHAGFGTGIAGTTSTAVCCGLSTVTATPVTLQTLSGNMKGGLFICSENGFYTGEEAAAPYGVYRSGSLWEDQFWSDSINRVAGDYYPAATYFGTSATGLPAATKVWNNRGNGDNYQFDVWTDGDVESFTTDVISGTWSIRLNTRLRGRALTAGEVVGTFLLGGTALANTNPQLTNVNVPALRTADGYTNANRQDIWDFNEMLKAAAVDLSSSVVFADGTEISARVGDDNRFRNLPMITPKFAAAYGLDGQHLYVAAPVLTAAPANTSIYR